MSENAKRSIFRLCLSTLVALTLLAGLMMGVWSVTTERRKQSILFGFPATAGAYAPKTSGEFSYRLSSGPFGQVFGVETATATYYFVLKNVLLDLACAAAVLILTAVLLEFFARRRDAVRLQ